MKYRKDLLLTSFFFMGCQATQKIENSGCSLYHNGDFVQHEYNNSNLGHWKKMSFLISRSSSLERIISSGTNLTDDTSYSHIKWLTSCSYEKTYTSGTNTYVDSLIEKKILPAKRTYFIIKGTDKYYIQKEGGKKDTIWIR